MVIKYLIEKEFKQFLRNSFLPRLIVIMPTMMLILFPWAANQEVKDLKVGVIDNDHSTYSQRLIQKVSASNYFTISSVSDTYSEAFNTIESGESDLLLEIENNFERNIVTSGESNVLISANAVDGVKSGLGSAYLGSIIADYSGDIAQENGIINANHGFEIAPRYEFNPSLDYKVFMIPALIVMMLTIFSGFLPALNIVGEKESGTMEQINVTPVGKFQFIISKLIPYWIIGFLVISYTMILAWLIYGLTPAGSVLTIYLFASIYIIVISGFGLIVSNFSTTMQQAIFVMFFFMMIFILLSGLFTPISSMPQWAQYITYINPLRYFIEVMRMVYLKGCSLSDLLPQLYSLCLFAIILTTSAIVSYKKIK